MIRKSIVGSIASMLILFFNTMAESMTYQVGPGKPYSSLQQVTNILEPGDVVEVDGDNVYPGDVVFNKAGLPNSPITIRGIRMNGHRPVISGGTNTVQFQTPWPYSGPGGDYYLFEGFEITGGSNRGIFHQANDIIIRDVEVHDCPAQGILGADEGSGSLLLEFVEVHHCGAGDQKHQIYMATDEVHYPSSVFRMHFCYIHDGNGGNNVKSRAERNEIYYNWIEGAYYHELELIGPEGGDGGNPELKREDSDVVGNVLWKKNSFYTTRVGGDGTGETKGRYRFVNNTFICGDSAVFRLFDGIESIEMHNNVFYRPNGGLVTIIRTVDAVWSSGSEQIAGQNNCIVPNSTAIPGQWTGTITGADPGFINYAAGDIRPAENSALIDAGAQSLSGPAGYPFPSPLFPPQFHPPQHTIDLSTESRPADNHLDIGAYERGTETVPELSMPAVFIVIALLTLMILLQLPGYVHPTRTSP